MHLRFISSRGALVPFAFRAKQAGHDVSVWLRDKSRQWDGILPKVSRFGEGLTKDHLLLFDSPGGGKTAERLQKQGYRVLGGSDLHDSLGEHEFARRELGKCGVKLSEGYGTASRSPGVWIEGWFNGERWINPATIAFVWRRLMPGELGPDIRSSMCCVTALPAIDKLVESTLWRTTVLLQRARFFGVLAFELDGDGDVMNVRTVVAPDVFAASQQLLDYTKLLDVMTSKDGMRLEQRADFAASIRVTQPWPKAHVVIEGVTREMLPFVDFFDVMNDPNNTLVTAGANGHVATVSAGGANVVEAATVIYPILGALRFKDRQFRVDLVDAFNLTVGDTLPTEVANA